MKRGASFFLYGVGPPYRKSDGECREKGQADKDCLQTQPFRKREYKKTHLKAHGESCGGRENKEQPAGCSALPPVPRRFFHSLPLPARRQPARTAKTENAPGHQYLQHPSEQPVAVTVCREGQSAVEQTGKPERKSDEPQSPAETSSECGADTGSENKRHAQGKKKTINWPSMRTSPVVPEHSRKKGKKASCPVSPVHILTPHAKRPRTYTKVLFPSMAKVLSWQS